MRGVQNLSVQLVDIGHALGPDEPLFSKMATVHDSTRVEFKGVHFHGSVDGNPANDGWGLLASNNTNLSVIDSKFHELRVGLNVEKSTGLKVSGSMFHDLSLDGIQVAGTSNVAIDRNYFDRFFAAAGDHPDAIQFFNTNMPTGSNNITVSNNVLLQTAGSGPQGIFISDPSSFGFSNILIRNNLLYGNDLWNGITVNGGKSVAILDNTVVSRNDDAKSFWIRLQDTDNVLVQNNAVDDVKVISGVTKLALIDNINFRVTPSATLKYSDLLNPSSSQDLIIPDAGYSIPVPATLSPAASAAGASLSGLLGASTQSSVGEAAVAVEPSEPKWNGSTVDWPGMPADVSSVLAGDGEPLSFSSALLRESFSIGWRETYLDSFAALP
jgi:hypothetical protein